MLESWATSISSTSELISVTRTHNVTTFCSKALIKLIHKVVGDFLESFSWHGEEFFQVFDLLEDIFGAVVEGPYSAIQLLTRCRIQRRRSHLRDSMIESYSIGDSVLESAR